MRRSGTPPSSGSRSRELPTSPIVTSSGEIEWRDLEGDPNSADCQRRLWAGEGITKALTWIHGLNSPATFSNVPTDVLGSDF